MRLTKSLSNRDQIQFRSLHCSHYFPLLHRKSNSFFLKPSTPSAAFMASISNSLPHNPISKKPHFLTPLSTHTSPQHHLPDQTPISKFVIKGRGDARLSGHVDISGSKNSALAVLAATLCCPGTSLLHNVPNGGDIRTMLSVLRSLGVEVGVCDGDVMIGGDGIRSVEPCEEAVGKIRGGFFVVGPLLARFGEAVVALPGGCDIGARPVDIYVKGFRALGAVVELRERRLHAHAKNGRGLVGGRFRLDFPSVGATETLMMTASMADGVTVLSNVAQEPEVVDLARFLNYCGASVEGAGGTTLIITGKKDLHGPEFTIIPDRIEAGTFMIAAAITRSRLSMSPVIPFHLSSLTDKLLAAGCEIIQDEPHTLEISASPSKTLCDLQGFNIKTGPFPKFPTDLQPQTTALLTTCRGQSIVEELVFEGRLGHVQELEKLGARFRVRGSTVIIYGKEQGSYLHGSHVVANDLRGGAALVLAGLAADGITEIDGVTHIDRGYENLETKLCRLGANIARKSSVVAIKH